MNQDLRSRKWFAGREELSFQHRSVLRSMGWDPDWYADRPVIGIANSFSDLNNCNHNLREIAEAVKRGVIAAGGLPLEFSTISLGEEFMKPSAMLYRNLMAMEIEETLRANPIDGVVLLCNCDKTTPAQLMGAASANLPAIQFNGGPRAVGRFRGRPVGSGTDIWRYWDEVRAGKLSMQDWRELEACIAPTPGACNVMGTASTMTALSELLGMMLPGVSSIPAIDARRLVAAEATGRRAVELVQEGLTPRQILTLPAFHNAIRMLLALGGSTNAVIHLIAIAGRVGLQLPLGLFDELSRSTPWLVNLLPSGKFLMEEFHDAGGVPAVAKMLSPLLDLTTKTVTGRTWGELLSQIPNRGNPESEVIKPLDHPLDPEGALAVLWGNLAPRGALIKRTAASPHLTKHQGRAIVFENYLEMLDQINHPDLPVQPDSVLVLRNAGPKGVPGFPEWGMIPVPTKLLEQGITDLVRISDSRMSGTSYGTIVLHVTPEAATGGPIGLVQTGDEIMLDLPNRRLEWLIEPVELERRKPSKTNTVEQHPRGDYAAANTTRRGYPKLYYDHVLQADEGCDFDFLRPNSPEDLEFQEPIVGRS